MSACGWPEPSTGIRLPRGQCEHSWSRRVSVLSSRIARSRYFSWISSSVAGKLTPSLAAMSGFFDGPDSAPSACISACRAAPRRAALGAAPADPDRRRLEELERLDVDEVLVLADDVGVAHRLEELLGPVEVVDADRHAAEALGDVAVRAGARDDPVLGGEALGLLVERGQRDPRVEHLEDVDLLDHVEQVLVVGHRVQAVERVRDVDQPALAADLGDRLRHRHPPRDLLLDEEADHLALLGRLHLLGDDHLDPAARSASSRAASAPETSLWSVIAIAPSPALLRRLQQHLDRRRAVRRVVGVHVEVDVDRLPPARAGAARPVAARGRGGARSAPVDRPRPRSATTPSRDGALAPLGAAHPQAGLGDQALRAGRRG